MQSIFLIAFQVQVALLLPMLPALSSHMEDQAQRMLENEDTKEGRKAHLQASQ